MKKLLMILMVLLLCACTSNKPAEDEPHSLPVPPASDPEPDVNNEPTPEEKEYVYQMEKGWIAYDFTLNHARQTYLITDDLTLKLEGKESEEQYCQDGKCLVYDIVTINDRDIEVLENLSVKINSDYGYMNMYNLNDELFLINFNYAAQFNSCAGVVIDKAGNIIKTYKDADLSMNEIYQNMFALSITNPNDITQSRFEVYTANGTELTMEVME